MAPAYSITVPFPNLGNAAGKFFQALEIGCYAWALQSFTGELLSPICRQVVSDRGDGSGIRSK